jgi:hypothetical protein
MFSGSNCLNSWKVWDMNVIIKDHLGHGIFEDIMITRIPIGLILWTCHKKYLLFQQSQPYVKEDFSN